VGFRRNFSTFHIPEAVSIRSELARDQIAGQDTEGRQGSVSNAAACSTLQDTVPPQLRPSAILEQRAPREDKVA